MYCITTSFRDYLEIIYFSVMIIGSLSILVIFLSYYLSKKHFNHNILIECNKRYQEILKQNPCWVNPEINILRQYLDLCSDELFYQQKKYIQDGIINDWLDGMISLLPHYIGDKNHNSDCKWINIKENENIYSNYKRVKATFSFISEKKYNEFKLTENDKDKYDILIHNLNNYGK